MDEAKAKYIIKDIIEIENFSPSIRQSDFKTIMFLQLF